MRKIYLLLCLFTFLQTAYAEFNNETTNTGNPLFASDVIQPADVTVCSGASTSAIVFTSNFPGTTFSWTNNNTSIGLAANGSGSIAAFTAVNSGTAPVVATITVTPSDGVSNGIARTFTITVNPIPNVNSIASQTICAATGSMAVNFSGSVPGTIYSWTNNNTATGLAASGSGNIPSFTTVNTTGSPITSTVTVTPKFGETVPELIYYKFDGSGNTVPNLASNPPAGTAVADIVGATSQGGSGLCNGTMIGGGSSGINNHINTNWQMNMNHSWSISFRTSGIPANSATCIFGSASGSFFRCTAKGIDALEFRLDVPSTISLEIPGVADLNPHTVTVVYNSSALTLRGYRDGSLVTNINLGSPINITSSTELLLGAFGGASFFMPNSVLLDEFRIYNRAIGASEVTDLANSCTPGAACAGAPQTFDITVLPIPVVDPVANQAVCDNTVINTIGFTSNVAGTSFTWTNNNTSIGLAANGSGSIPSFTATNTSTSIETATITITPVAPGVPACAGTPQTFTITVYPFPVGGVTVASQTLCSDGFIRQIDMTANVPATSFSWTRDHLTEVVGIPASGSGSISGFVTNTTTAQVTVTFTIIPSVGGCDGAPVTATVTVDPAPVATSTPASQTICSGPIADIVHSSNMSGTLFSWTRDNTADVTGIAASGTGDISGSLINTTSTPVLVTFTITPSAGGCSGVPVLATVLVNATPTIICPSNITLDNTTGMCGTIPTYPTTVTGAPAPTLTYTMSGASNGSGGGNGSGNLFHVGVTTVTVTATNTCGSASCSFTVTVNDTENPVINCPSNIQANTDAGTCSAMIATPDPVATDNCGVTEQTWVLTGATTGASPLTGINNVGTALFNKGVTTVTYVIHDAAGNSATCSYTVTVRDQEIPVAVCPANISVTTPIGTCVAEVAYPVTATDNCPGVTTQIVSGPASGSAFPIGTTTITWRAIDAAGNISANCSFTITVLDGQLPVISSQPANRTVCAGSNATFSVTASNVVTYQWQQWNGTAWVNINGANSSSYTVNNVTTSMNDNTYRVVLNGLCTVVNSNAATLFVNPLPTISISANPRTSLLPPQTTSIVATVSPTGGSFVWRKNGGIVPGVSGATLSPLTVDHIGTYNTTYTDLNGCIITSPDIAITGSPTEVLWVYPNPNQGEFQVRYYNNFGEPATVMVFNAAGQLVYSKAFVIGEPYSRMNVDIRNQPAGVYIVKLISGNGKELAAKRIIVVD